MFEAILHLHEVTKGFPGTLLPAVDSVTLTLYRGELLSLLGPSGCGKTTLLRLIAGFERPQKGRVFLAEEEIACPLCNLPPERRQVGMVFQDYALFPHLTVAKNIAFGLKKCNLNRSQAQEQVKSVMQLVGLEGLAQRYPHELSGGQQQRVALARALAPSPSLILLDEPLSNLDVQVRLRLRQELRSILKAAGTSAILVTHDQEEALSISDRVAVMRQGRLEQIDTPERVYAEPATRFVAEFVTQANFLPAHCCNRAWETELGGFTLADFEGVDRESAGFSETDAEPVEHQADLMVRQEDLLLSPATESGIVVRDRQFLGREHRYSLQTPSGQELVARTSALQTLEIGTPVAVSFNPQLVRLFPAKRSLTSHEVKQPLLSAS
jgi:iron(III) transport system ATP-binding protein